MTRARLIRYALLPAVLLLAPVGLAVAQPHAAACAMMRVMPLERLPGGTYADAGVSAVERRAAIDARAAALRRIATRFGNARSQPLVVHVAAAGALWPFTYNSFGSTDFLLGRTCIVLGPDGRNVDVTAHELLHAEIADRLGFFARWRRLPVWFDEGAAMQVDDRAAFDSPPSVGETSIQDRDTAASFFAVPPDRLTDNYAQAKRIVAAWLQKTGRQDFYRRLKLLRQGQTFDEFWAG